MICLFQSFKFNELTELTNSQVIFLETFQIVSSEISKLSDTRTDRTDNCVIFTILSVLSVLVFRDFGISSQQKFKKNLVIHVFLSVLSVRIHKLFGIFRGSSISRTEKLNLTSTLPVVIPRQSENFKLQWHFWQYVLLRGSTK